MVALPDFSELRKGAERVDVPLNGVMYYAVPDPPGQVMLEASGVADSPDLARLQQLVAKAQRGDKLAELESDPEGVAAAAKVGSDMAVRMVRFVQGVLEPESAKVFAYNFAPHPPPPGPDASPEAYQEWKLSEQAHAKARISMPQLGAVFRALMQHYGGRPTTPSSSSVSGSDAGGGTSTAGAPAAE